MVQLSKQDEACTNLSHVFKFRKCSNTFKCNRKGQCKRQLPNAQGNHILQFSPKLRIRVCKDLSLHWYKVRKNRNNQILKPKYLNWLKKYQKLYSSHYVYTSFIFTEFPYLILIYLDDREFDFSAYNDLKTKRISANCRKFSELSIQQRSAELQTAIPASSQITIYLLKQNQKKSKKFTGI